METLINGVVVLIATALGAWIGVYFIDKKQESRKVYARELLKSFLKSIQKYEYFNQAESEFNNKSTLEKKAVIVALKNLGVPIVVAINDDAFNIEEITFKKQKINKNEIDKMIQFINDGLCDNLFFKEISYDFYNTTPKIIYAREIATKLLDAIATQNDKSTWADAINAANLNFNVFQVVEVFALSADVWVNNYPSKEKIETAKKNINNGVFDHLFYWDRRAYDNMLAQRKLADTIILKTESSVSANQESTQTVLKESYGEYKKYIKITTSQYESPIRCHQSK